MIQNVKAHINGQEYNYQVTFKYHIGPEILKAKIFVEVV